MSPPILRIAPTATAGKPCFADSVDNMPRTVRAGATAIGEALLAALTLLALVFVATFVLGGLDRTVFFGRVFGYSIVGFFFMVAVAYALVLRESSSTWTVTASGSTSSIHPPRSDGRMPMTSASLTRTISCNISLISLENVV